MTDLISTDRFIAQTGTSAQQGHVAVDWPKTTWLLSQTGLGITGVIIFPQFNALLVFLVLSALTICAGHSVGMHRLLIHRSFETPKAMEYVLVWLGTLVGMAGPIGMIRTHDLRDWHQRQSLCPPHPAHAAPFFKDAWWQLCCRFELRSPPKFALESTVRDDRFYAFLETNWRLQQIPVALLLYWLGGWAFVLWGCCLRVSVSLIGHWMVGHFAHRRGHQGWEIRGLQVQGYNLPGFGWLTFGENWHGNHHAFPHSAQLGVDPGQRDPGFALIQMLARLGLAWNIQTPDSAPKRAGLVRICQTH